MERGERAVSPVVGVMLMLTITIIVAAVISAFAGGLGAPQERTPQLTVTASVYNSTTLCLDHMGGDAIPLEDIVIVLDQAEKSLRFSNATLDRAQENDMRIKAGGSLYRSGDTLVLKGILSTDATCFNTTSASIALSHGKEFTWTLLSSRGDAILARGRLAFAAE
ncbi:MAG: type IV pilin N-terminal domain-containing protein [Methanomicrobiales archaeon]|nr:type IV pilin N-terminal domain-containing protein [Methanomicrobiales archaeon]